MIKAMFEDINKLNTLDIAICTPNIVPAYVI
jgi:hypothetical protein